MNDSSTNTYSVAVVGASARPGRYSGMAVERYRAAGWETWPVHPSTISVAGLKTYPNLKALPGSPTVISMYVNPKAGAQMLDDIVAAQPRYLWLNPGADGEPIASAARARGLTVVETCNLVALSIGDPLEVAERWLADNPQF